MNKFYQNKCSIILIGLLIMYWFFVIYAALFASNDTIVKRVYQSSLGVILFPPDYHMVSSVPNQTVKTYYEFYKQNELIYVYDIDSAYNSKLTKSFPSLELKRDLKVYSKIFNLNNLALGNASNSYAFDTILQNNKSLQAYLLDNKRIRNIILNQMAYAKRIQQETPIVTHSDSFHMKIVKKYIFIEEDPDAMKNFEYWVQDTLLYSNGKSVVDVSN